MLETLATSSQKSSVLGADERFASLRTKRTIHFLTSIRYTDHAAVKGHLVLNINCDYADEDALCKHGRAKRHFTNCSLPIRGCSRISWHLVAWASIEFFFAKH